MDSKNKLVQEQTAPKTNEEEAVWDLVIRDMTERDAEGFRKYKTRLQRFNGRNAVIDAYQESLDQTVYLRQAIEEKKMILAVLLFYAHENDGGDKAKELLKKLGEWDG